MGKKRPKSKMPSQLSHRNVWTRKPQTQIVRNRKAEQRRSWCRKGTDDGAVLLFGGVPRSESTALPLLA